MVHFDRPRPDSQDAGELLNRTLISAFGIARTTAFAALGLAAVAAIAEGQGRRSVSELTKLPPACSGTDAGACRKALVPQLEELSKTLMDPETIKSQSPFYNPKVDSLERCRFLSRMIDQHGETFQELSDYFHTHHKQFVDEIITTLKVQNPDLLKDITSVSKDARKQLGLCLISPLFLERGLKKREDKLPEALAPLGKAIELISQKFQQTAKMPQEEALAHAKALRNAMTVLNAATRYREIPVRKGR